jgi:hypothetical protein
VPEQFSCPCLAILSQTAVFEAIRATSIVLVAAACGGNEPEMRSAPRLVIERDWPPARQWLGRPCHRNRVAARSLEVETGNGREGTMAASHRARHSTAGSLLVPLGIGAVLGFVAANARSTLNFARVEGRPSRMGLLHAGARMLQSMPPVDAMSVYLNGFHFYADDMGRQVEAHHYCTHLSEDMHQCAIYDSDRPDARLIGIEYIVSERLFRRLPEDEKRLWHSHHYEVKSGTLVGPGLPEMAEHAAVADLASTYGKTFHTWQIDRDDLPLGVPQLMMGFTRDGQVDPELVRQRDRRFGISTEEKRRRRADIPTPVVQPGANAWEDGPSAQTELKVVELRNRR